VPHKRSAQLPRQPLARGFLSALAALAFLVTSTITATTASADPEPDLAAVREKVEMLGHQAEQITEDYNATRENLKSVNVAIRAATVRVGQQNKLVDVARQALGEIAAETYKAGEFEELRLLLDEDPSSLLAVSGLRSSLSDRQARAVAALVAAQKQLDDDHAALKQQQGKLAEAKATLGAQEKRVKAKLAEARELLSRLDGTQRRALQRTSRTLDADALADLGVQVPASGLLNCDNVGIKAPNARAKVALAFACAQLGKPYQWGGDGPGSYDCSGLVQAAWGKAGVSLPHNAAMQAGYGERVSASQLEPGDVVFFYSPIGHNGIYIGKGLMVHAPSTGNVIKVAPARLNQLTAAVRL
jgi:cell wall-associated NlpC family hydrolase